MMMALNELTARFVQDTRSVFGDNLTAVYLHGSAVMGCFNPRESDVDLLVVVKRVPTDAEKIAFIEKVVELDRFAPAKGLELSVVREEVCNPLIYPTPYELHFSHAHLERWYSDHQAYIDRLHGTDRDLGAHMAVIRARGEMLFGRPTDEVIGEVSRDVYWDSIWYDVGNAVGDILEMPMYITLNLCRALAYWRENVVLSKKEGGEWALNHVDDRYFPLIREALHAYSEEGHMTVDPEIAQSFARYIHEQCTDAG